MTPEEIAAEFHRRRVIVMQVEYAQSVYAEHANRVQRGMDKMVSAVLDMARQGIAYDMLVDGIARYAEQRGLGDGSEIPMQVKRGNLIRPAELPDANLGQKDITAT